MMPYAAARYWLPVRGLHIHRLREIETDPTRAIQEEGGPFVGLLACKGTYAVRPTLSEFKAGWDNINKQARWDTNPWVVRYDIPEVLPRDPT